MVHSKTLKPSMHYDVINRPSPKVERSTWRIGAALDLALSDGATGKDVDLIVNMQGLEPVY